MVWASGLLLLAAGARADAAPIRVLVQRVEAVSGEAQLARSLEEALVFELGRRAAFEVVSPAELEETVKLARL
ncbi:MAG TPA: hypothetical protein VJR89_14640, partial [Polyangiales bacterium]|nr:hypothetical protein [Polyangiales bacterium]